MTFAKRILKLDKWLQQGRDKRDSFDNFMWILGIPFLAIGIPLLPELWPDSKMPIWYNLIMGSTFLFVYMIITVRIIKWYLLILSFIKSCRSIMRSETTPPKKRLNYSKNIPNP